MPGNRPIRLLFLAFGYSIHAHRRVQVFASDPGFKVHLVSDHAYEIENVEVTRLDGPAGLVRAKRHLAPFANAVTAFLRKRHVDEISAELFREMTTQLMAYRQLLHAVRRFRPDAVFQQTLLYPSYLGCLLPPEIPRFITFWNGDLVWWAQQNEILKRFKHDIVETGIRQAVAVTVNSGAAREVALDYGIAPERLHVIRYPGVDLAHFTPDGRDEARQKLGLGSGPVVLCPRGLGGYLNSDVLMEAACALCKVMPDVTFLFVSGVGRHLWDDLMRMPTALGLARNFRHDGHIPWDSMPDYHRAADIMVSPSSNDSQPNCMLEAMACGTAVVMGDIPSIREWVSHGRNGLLAPPRDPAALAAGMLTLLRNPRQRQAFAAMNLRILRDRVDSVRQCAEVRGMVRNTLQQQ